MPALKTRQLVCFREAEVDVSFLNNFSFPFLVIESLLDSEEMMGRVKEILDRHNREVAERDEEDA